MAKDLKVIQRGVNVMDNDLAVGAGTLQHAVNVDFYRGGTASKRTGFEAMYNGIPEYEVDSSYNPSDSAAAPVNRSFWELFSRDRLMCNANGMLFAYDESQNYWYSVPVNLPHRFTFFGVIDNAATGTFAGFGNALQFVVIPGPNGTPFTLQQTRDLSSGYLFVGTICNDASQAKIAGSGTLARWRRPGDVVLANSTSTFVVSDDTSIRNAITGTVIAGQIGTPGSTNGTGAAASFSGASWMASDGLDTVWVADNANMIRKIIISTGVVTTLAGTVAAGDADGTGVAATFRGISGLAYDGSANLYVTESGGHRIRKVVVATGVVTIFAGSLTPTSGYLDATGTAARFNAPSGIELIFGTTYYIGDSGNNRIRTMTAGAVVGTLNNVAGTIASDGLVGNVAASAITPGVVVRGQYISPSGVSSKFPAGTYLAIECTPRVTTGTIDCGLVNVTNGALAAQQHVYHYARCPSAYPTATTGPNKLDSVGPNAYSSADTRGVDIGGGVAFNTCALPRAIDSWTKLAAIDTMPRLRDLGIRQPEAPVVTTTAGTTFAAGTSWAYRYLCGLKLPDGRIALGPPSERVIGTNATGGALAGSITCFPSPGLPYDGMPFFQVYRTKTTTSAALDPNDQMFLCYETPITYGSGLVFTDLTPDGLLGAELYTNQTADGQAFSSLPPPAFASEIASFNKQLVVGNYIPQASIRVKMIGTGPLVAGTSTITFTQGPAQGAFSGYPGATLTLNAIAGVTVPASNNFQIGTGGSAAQNAAQTARNIVSCINRSPDAYFFQAFYDENDPGAFVVVSLYPGASKTNVTTRASGKTLTQSSITFTTNTTLAFFTVQANVATRLQNAVAYSDFNEPDSMPIGYTLNIGPNTEAIQRILPLADRAIAVKDDSCWSFDQQFNPQIYDAALSTNFPNSFARINNQWIGLFTRGFCNLNTTQAVAIGRPIDRDVTTQFATSLTGTNFVSGAAIDVYGNYLCTVNDRTFCYNVLSQSWSEWQVNSMVSQDTFTIAPYPVPGSGIARYSGMQSLAAFRDCFVINRDFARGVLRQRDFRRGGTALLASLTNKTWFENYSDAAYSLTGTIASGLLTITGTYNAQINPGILPPNLWQVPSGAGSVTVGAAFMSASFPWGFLLTQGAVTALAMGSLVFATPTSPTSAFTIALTSAALGDFTPGAITVAAYAPILNRMQYTPTVHPGSNNQFGDVLVTMERLQAGPLAIRSFNRRDAGLSYLTAVGAFADSQGFARVVNMSAGSLPVSGIATGLLYDDIQRSPSPSERSADQQLIVEIWEGACWQPLAIKSVSIDDRELQNGKVRR